MFSQKREFNCFRFQFGNFRKPKDRLTLFSQDVDIFVMGMSISVISTLLWVPFKTSTHLLHKKRGGAVSGLAPRAATWSMHTFTIWLSPSSSQVSIWQGNAFQPIGVETTCTNHLMRPTTSRLLCLFYSGRSWFRVSPYQDIFIRHDKKKYSFYFLLIRKNSSACNFYL